jgi:hypothetical protein
MNKFDDMMRFLASRDANFGQVVAVDARFDLFSRAWCVGELAEARRAGMTQSMQLRSGQDVAERQVALKNLKVQDMQASRPEDVEEILKKITDAAGSLDAFNAALQELIFNDKDGLFATWRGKDAEEQMSSIGRLVRWGAVSDDSSVLWRNWTSN